MTTPGTMLHRAFRILVRAEDIDEETREVPFVIATENPADMGCGMPEILLVSGMEIEDAERGVPMLNAHNRLNVTDVLGRVVKIKVKGSEVHAVYRFSDATKEARDAFGLVKDGSIDAASIGYQINTFAEVAEGETFIAPEGEKIEGPAIVGIAWTLKESSLVPIGVDKDALKRALSAATQEKTMPKTAKKTAKKATKKKAKRRSVAKKAKKADDEEDDSEKDEGQMDEEKVDGEDDADATDEEKVDGEDDSTDDEEDTSEDEGSTDDEEEDDAEDEDSSKSIDALDARQRTARRKQILSFTPTDLRAFAEDLILNDPAISPGAARAALLSERAKRLTSVGSMPPAPVGKQRSTKAPEKGKQTKEENGSTALTHLISEG